MAVPDALLIVEGPHDAEFVGRLLKAADYHRVTQIGDLPNEWRKLVPTTFPKSGRGINQPHEAPQFRNSPAGDLVMTLISGGDARLAEGFAAAFDALGRSPAAVGFVLDDDRQPNPIQRHAALIATAQEIVGGAMPAFPGEPGIILAGPPRSGVFVFPDNQAQGSLEDLLLEAGQVAYPKLLAYSARFVAEVDRAELTPEDLQEGNKNAGPKKQTIAAATAILKPTRALATSLQDNRWLIGEALERPLVARFRAWLHDLLDINAAPPIP
jgi:hypothetical protein